MLDAGPLSIRPRRHRLPALLVCTAVVTSLLHPTPQAHAEQDRAMIVTVAAPQRVVDPRRATLPGTLEAWERAPLYARVTGYVESVAVEIGDEVEAGAELATITVPEMDSQLAAARARVEQGRAELELAKLTRSRNQELRRHNADAVAKQAVDQSAAEEKVEQARLQLAEAELARLEALADFSTIRAPFSGRITKRLLHPGALAKEGTNSGAEPVVEISRSDRLRLRFYVPGSMIAAVHKGQTVHVRLDALPGRTIEAEVSRLSGMLNPATRSARAEIDVSNASGDLQPGMYASIDLTAERVPSWAVASRAVRGNGQERYVLVVENDLCVRRDVLVVEDDGRTALLARGVTESDSVVVAGSPLARHGSACRAAVANPQ